MAKKVFKNLSTMIQEAKTFEEMLGILIERTTNSLNYNKREAKKKTQSALKNRSQYLAEIKSDEVTLKRYEARRLRFEKYQADASIPAELREKIAKLETDLLGLENTSFCGHRFSTESTKRQLDRLFKEVDLIKNPPKPHSTVNKDFKVGKNYLCTSIIRAYDSDVWNVLSGHFEIKEKSRMKIVAALPEKDEYLQLQERHFTISLETLVDKAYWMLDDLLGDLESAYEEMFEDYPYISAADELSTAIDQIKLIAKYPPLHPDLASKISLVRYPSNEADCPDEKAEDAASMMEMALMLLQNYVESGIDLNEDDAADLEKYRLELEEGIEEIRNVDIPDLDECYSTYQDLLMEE